MPDEAGRARAGACRELATFLTGAEAKEVADRLDDGDTLPSALRAVALPRRHEVEELLHRAGLGARNRDLSVQVLRAVEGAHARTTSVGSVWTLPGNLASTGQLTASVEHFVLGARESVTCSTFNFQRSSALWAALRTVSRRPEVAVRLYLDSTAADNTKARGADSQASSLDVARALEGARVLRTKKFGGRLVRNHAKFIAVDHQYLLVTSANFSLSAERLNVEFGLVLENAALAQTVEEQLLAVEPDLFELVSVGLTRD